MDAVSGSGPCFRILLACKGSKIRERIHYSDSVYEGKTKLSKKILLAVTISHLDLPLSFILPTATLVVVLLIVGQS